ncbi:MAG TPA: DUF3035 domain-containing protein [Acetobacteraceae bacterium]|nr:DUF3035 domain-containing protein [Acetobacteraceae bacterium]
MALGGTLALPLVLSACGGSNDLSRMFDFSRDAPDEFRVTTRAPLSMPPDYSLRPPRPGAPRPQEQSETTQAEAVLVPEVELNQGATSMSQGEQALVQAAGPPAPKDIRAEVDEESVKDIPSESFAERLMFWRPAPQPGTVLDPVAEAARLRQDAALGRSPEVGSTPIIQRQGSSLFGNLF